MSEDSDTPVFVQDAKYYIKDREEWLPSDDEESEDQYMVIKNTDKAIKRKTRKELIHDLVFYKHVSERKSEQIKKLEKKLKILQKQIEEAKELAPVIIDE